MTPGDKIVGLPHALRSYASPHKQKPIFRSIPIYQNPILIGATPFASHSNFNISYMRTGVIGIISHVAELKERIQSRIDVISSKDGSKIVQESI
jgi:hypothetical protein